MKSTMLFAISLCLSVAIAGERGQRGPGGGGPQLTDAQKTCLEGKIGAPGSGNRPSREAMEAAFSACGVEKPKGPPPGGRGQEQQDQNQEQADSE
nr:hypothetical protein BHI3_30440 [Bacteriovorax sp. HI3]